MDCKIAGCENEAAGVAVTPFGDVPICAPHAEDRDRPKIFEALKVAAGSR